MHFRRNDIGTDSHTPNGGLGMIAIEFGADAVDNEGMG
jgi:aconitase A